MTLWDLVQMRWSKDWGEKVQEGLRRCLEERYGARWERRMQLRVNSVGGEDGVPFAAVISAGQPKVGAYGGMSFAIFPTVELPALVTLVVGTNGLAPDEAILGRPGHARKVAAISRWLNQVSQRWVAWAKQDPVRIDRELPRQVQVWAGAYEAALDKYGHVIYCLLLPQEGVTESVLADGVMALLDLMAEEHGVEPLKGAQADRARIIQQWMAYALPRLSVDQVVEVLLRRRFVILEGPPGTGKTHLAEQLRRRVDIFPQGRTIQFHPSTTYEVFVGGLAPEVEEGGGGFGVRFRPRRGLLMEAIVEASAQPAARYLLHIDEINRADLAKVLGEAIYLLEPNAPDRRVVLPYDFGAPIGRELWLPRNLYVIGTMNSSDRSIALLDVAIRRRFAFLTLWPDGEVLEQQGASEESREAFRRLMMVFLEEASEDGLLLMPGHAYFLDGGDPMVRRQLLGTGLRPLLKDYLQQGYVSGFADEVRAYLDWLEILIG